MADDNETKPKPRLIGDYLPLSKGSLRIAMQKKRELKLKGLPQSKLGEILIDLDIIEPEDLENAIRQQRADRLGLCPVFKSLSRTELAGISKHFTEIGVQANQQFIFEGEDDPSLYVLVEGKVEVFTKDENGDEIHIAFVEPIEPIGEMGYFQGGLRTASVRAVIPTELLIAPYKNLTHYFEHVPHVAHAFLDVIKQRQAETAAKLEEAKGNQS